MGRGIGRGESFLLLLFRVRDLTGQLFRARGESSVFVLDRETSECLHYEALTGYPRNNIVRIPREILATHPEVEIRNDLIDCSIDVCSVEVCAHRTFLVFSVEFSYRSHLCFKTTLIIWIFVGTLCMGF